MSRIDTYDGSADFDDSADGTATELLEPFPVRELSASAEPGIEEPDPQQQPAPPPERAPSSRPLILGTPAVLFFMVCVVGSFVAGAFVGGNMVEAVPAATLVALICLLPVALVVSAGRRLLEYARSFHGSADATAMSAVESAVERLGGLVEETVARSESLENQVESELSRSGVELQRTIAKDLEKVRVFFETLLEKHVHRINRELRAKEAELTELKKLRESEQGRASEESEDARRRVELEEEVGRLRDEVVAKDFELEKLRGDLERERESVAAAVGASQSLFRGGSRQLRNHLQNVRRLADGVASAVDSDAEKTRKDIEEMRTHLAATDRLMTQIVDLETLQTGRWKSVVSEVSVRDFIDRSVEPLREKAREKGVRFQVRVPKDVGQVKVDQKLLGRALTELTGNAVAYTDKGGFVAISAQTAKDGAGHDVTEITVKDSGHGIPEGDLERIFLPFEQSVEPRFSLVGAGLGLGLALARAYAKQIGGDLSVESTEGRGSAFTLTVPHA